MTTPTPGAASELHENTHRWNIERDGEALLICFGDHDKDRPCQYMRYSPAPVQVKPVDGGSASDSTKESSREAVAWRSRYTMEAGRLSDWHYVDKFVPVASPSTGYEVEALYTAPTPPDRVQPREQETIDALAASQNAAATFSDSYAALVKRIWNLAEEWRAEAAIMRNPDGKAILAQCADELDIARAHLPDRVQPERAEAFDYWRLREWATMFADQGFTEAASDMNAAADFIEEAQETPIGRALELIAHAREWFNHSPHGDNCYVSDHYEGDPGNRCNCGRDSLERAFDAFYENIPAPPPPDRVQTRNPESSQPERVEANPKGSDAFIGEMIGCRAILNGVIIPPAPPTDASGGVTDAMVQAAAEAYLGHKNGPHSRVPRDAMRAAIEAADRARKPVDASAQADDQPYMEMVMSVCPELETHDEYRRFLSKMRDAYDASLAPPTDASGGVTDAMVEAALHATFDHDDAFDSEDRKLMRAALEAADRARKQTPVATQPVDASAQAASAGEPVAWQIDWHNGNLTLVDTEPNEGFMIGRGASYRPLYAAPTPVAAYREVQNGDVGHYWDWHEANYDFWTAESFGEVLRKMGAVIRTTDAPSKDREPPHCPTCDCGPK